MNRRGFFRIAGAGLIVAVTPRIFLPPRGGWNHHYFIPRDHTYSTSFERSLCEGPMIDVDALLRQFWDKYAIHPTYKIVSREEYEEYMVRKSANGIVRLTL